jgi:hypothetical protein
LLNALWTGPEHRWEGLSNREIAERLFVSTNTLRKHTYNLYGKLGAHSRMQAITGRVSWDCYRYRRPGNSYIDSYVLRMRPSSRSVTLIPAKQ